MISFFAMIASSASTGTPPHLFLDSANSAGASEDSEQWNQSNSSSNSSTPHMFLSYAHPDNKTGGYVIPETEAGANLRNHGRNKVVRGRPSTIDLITSTPHLFLPYASSHERKHVQHPLSDQTKQHNHLSLDRDVLSFEAHCLDSFRVEQGLNTCQTLVAAKALGMAAKQAATIRNDDCDDLFSFYCGVLDRATTSSKREDVTENDDISLSLSNIAEEPSHFHQRSSSSNASQSEIEFLRFAVKELILQLGSAEAPVPREARQEDLFSPQRIDFQRSDYPQLYTQEGTPEQAPYNDIPNKIEFYKPYVQEVIVDDMSEPVSLLTPFEGQHMTVLDTHALYLPQIYRTSALALQPPFNIPQMKVFDVDTSKSTSSESCSRFMETMKLVFNCRPGQPTRLLLQNKEESRPDRARGMWVEIAIQGVSFTGCYSGRLLQGVPHGDGVLRFHNRDLYIGNFFDGEMHGEGTLFCRSNRRLAALRGKFERNEFVGTRCADDSMISAGAAA
jgi:hypothetical protein